MRARSASPHRRLSVPVIRLAGVLLLVPTALFSAVVVAGDGTGIARHTSREVGAWLENAARDEFVHVNGLSGTVDWSVPGGAADNHPLSVSPLAKGVLLFDDAAGLVRRVDPNLMSADGPGLEVGSATLVAGRSAAFVLDFAGGDVRAVDPTTLAWSGRTVGLGQPVGSAVVTDDGTLWAQFQGTTKVVGVHGSRLVASFDATNPSGLTLGAMGDLVVAYHGTGDTVTVYDDGDIRQLRVAGAGEPALLAGTSRAVLAPTATAPRAATALLLVDPDGTSARIIDPRPAGFAGPVGGAVRSGARGYLLDAGTGFVLPYDSEAIQKLF